MRFFDSYAIIELFEGNSSYEKYALAPIITSALNLGEVHYHYLKHDLEKDFFRVISSKEVECLEIAPKVVYSAMRFKLANRKKNLSFVDCVGYALAEANNLVFLTGDKEFKNQPNVEWVP